MYIAIGHPAEEGIVSTELPDMIQGVDHLIVLGADLERSQRLWRAAGFTLTPRGFHQSGGTANHLVMLDRTYIELLGMADSTTPSPYRAMAEQAPGLWGIALRGSAEATYGFWHAQGLDPAPPASLARPVTIEGREELARFALTQLPRSRELPFLVFCCEHLTREFVWRQDLPPHPNGATALREVLIVDAGAVVRRRIERIVGRAVSGGDQTGTLQLADCRVSFLSKTDFTRRVGSETAACVRCAPPMLAGFALAVRDLENARRWAQRAGWPIRHSESGGFTTAIAEAGVVIEWSLAQ